MKMLSTASVLSLALATQIAYANEPTEQDAIALVEKGAALVKAEGKAKLIERINAKDPAFYQDNGALYLMVRDSKTSTLLAHPANPALIGKDLLDVPDTNGKKFRHEIVELAATKGKGWVDYTYRNPTTNKIEPKTTYIMKVGEITLDAGIYKK